MGLPKGGHFSKFLGPTLSLLFLHVDPGNAQAKDTYSLLHSGSWCNEQPLLDFGNKGVNPTVLSDDACQEICTNDPACEVYAFGFQPEFGALRCATYSQCSPGGAVSDGGTVSVYRRQHSAVSASSLMGNCFVLLASPMETPPIPDEAVAKMRKYFLANLDVNGTGRSIASPGPIPALEQITGHAGGYSYHWTRDGALSLAALQNLLGWSVASVGTEAIVTQDVVQEKFKAYVDWVEKLHTEHNVDVYGEPIWNIQNGSVFTGGWCRPQTDGPPLRAWTLIRYAGGGFISPEEESRIWKLVKLDLDWVAKKENVNLEGCDMWEETRSTNFLWNRVVMRGALEAGAFLADRMGDSDRAQRYRYASETIIGDPLQDHIEESGHWNYFTECPAKQQQGSSCEKYEKSIDGAVILALVHSGIAGDASSGAGMAASKAVASTILVYNEAFCGAYSINSQDSTTGIPGVLYGRYLKDAYGGGNPWVLITAALAILLYLAAQEVAKGVSLPEDALTAWRTALQAEDFRGRANDFLAAGDSVLARLRHHIDALDDWHLYEQLSKYTGKQYNAKDLTWSYAEVLSALKVRESALALSRAQMRPLGLPVEMTDPGNCFVPISGPLAYAPFDDDAIAKMRKHFMANLNINGTGAMTASPGEVPALKDCCPGGYNYSWVRDGALSMLSLLSMSRSPVGTVGRDNHASQEVADKMFATYMTWVKHQISLNGTSFQYNDGQKTVEGVVDSHREPKWNVATGLPYTPSWCRRQSDGAPLRAQALMAYVALQTNETLRKEAWELALFDLDWIATAAPIHEETCDLWEETEDKEFLWNRFAMRAALVQGAQMALEMGDSDRHDHFLTVAGDELEEPLLDHMKFNATAAGSFMTECPVSSEGTGSSCDQYKKDIDGAVILALVHRYRFSGGTTGGTDDSLYTPIATSVARTVEVYNSAFCNQYPINTADTKEGIPGVLYGRYLKDQYGGGNPWQLITASLASLLYQAAQYVKASGINPEGTTKLAWQAALGPQFQGHARDFVSAGDAVLLRLRHHIKEEDDMHLYEQIDKTSGEQYNAKDLTWSYAEVLLALQERDTAVSLGAAEPIPPVEKAVEDVLGPDWKDEVGSQNWSLFFIGILLGGCFFSVYGIYTACKKGFKAQQARRRPKKYGCLNRVNAVKPELRTYTKEGLGTKALEVLDQKVRHHSAHSEP